MLNIPIDILVGNKIYVEDSITLTPTIAAHYKMT